MVLCHGMGSMKTNPTAKARGHSSKGTAKRDSGQASAVRAARRMAKNPQQDEDDFGWAGKYRTPKEPPEDDLTDEDGPADPAPEKYKTPAKQPLPDQVQGCFTRKKGHGNGKYIELTPLGLETIRDLASLGRSITTIAYVCGMSRGEMTQVLAREDVRDALELGKGFYEDRFSDALMRMADHGNVAAAIWVEKTRFGKRDNAPVSDGAKHVHIHLPDSVSREQYMASLALVHAETHRVAIEASREPEAKTELAEPKPTWVTDGQVAGEPSPGELQALVQEALKEPPQAEALPPKPAPAEEPLKRAQTSRSLDVDR